MYTSGSLSLAGLELLVHVDSDLLPSNLVFRAVAIPPSVEVEHVDPSRLTAKWQQYNPSPSELQRFGAAWVAEGRTCVLRVPSAVVPEEHNYLINPLHPQFGQLQLEAARPFTLDPRLKRGG